MQIEVENLHELLNELKRLREQRDELQRNQTKLVNENRDNDLSCQLRREFELLVGFGQIGSLSSPLPYNPEKSLAKLAFELATKDRTVESSRLYFGIPRAAVARLVHEMAIKSAPYTVIVGAIDRLLRDEGYRGS